MKRWLVVVALAAVIIAMLVWHYVNEGRPIESKDGYGEEIGDL